MRKYDYHTTQVDKCLQYITKVNSRIIYVFNESVVNDDQY